MYSSVDGLLDTVLRDYITSHSERVTNIAIQVGMQCGLNNEELVQLELGAMLHDIGKIGISDQILMNPGQLSHQDYETMKFHTVIGANIVEKLNIPHPDKVAEIIRHHHEHFDGSGYPNAMVGQAIPLQSRIIMIIDIFDSLISDRSYRNALTHYQALQEMEKDVGTIFDPEIFGIAKQVILEMIINENDWAYSK